MLCDSVICSLSSALKHAPSAATRYRRRSFSLTPGALNRAVYQPFAFEIQRGARNMNVQARGGGFSTSTSETAMGGQQDVKLVNMLSESRSPYVRGHMKNPVAWQMWTPEALALARKMDKLLFVSIGYSACHCMINPTSSPFHPSYLFSSLTAVRYLQGAMSWSANRSRTARSLDY